MSDSELEILKTCVTARLLYKKAELANTVEAIGIISRYSKSQQDIEGLVNLRNATEHEIGKLSGVLSKLLRPGQNPLFI